MTPVTRLAIATSLGLAVVFGAALAALQQDPASGQIAGAVTDTTRAVVPGAMITLDGRRLPSARTATSDRSGAFQFTGLAPGSYLVRVQLAGFDTVTRENVAVTAGGRVDVNISLPIHAIVDRVARLDAMRAGEVGVDLETPH